MKKFVSETVVIAGFPRTIRFQDQTPLGKVDKKYFHDSPPESVRQGDDFSETV